MHKIYIPGDYILYGLLSFEYAKPVHCVYAKMSCKAYISHFIIGLNSIILLLVAYVEIVSLYESSTRSTSSFVSVSVLLRMVLFLTEYYRHETATWRPCRC